MTNKHTTERIAWLRQNYETSLLRQFEIINLLNDMPGAHMDDRDLKRWVYDMGLKRGQEYFSRIRSGLPNRHNNPFRERRAGAGQIDAARADGAGFSMAAAMEHDAMVKMEDCPIMLADALEWGRRNGLHKSGNTIADVAATNRIRREHRLPPYRIIPDKGKPEPLPRLLTHLPGDR